jgi:hypothetical protein
VNSGEHRLTNGDVKLIFTGSDAVDFHALQKDLEIIHNYRHDDCIKLIIGELSICKYYTI